MSKEKITLTFVGRDSWDRPVYKNENNRLCVDVDPRDGRKPQICTKYRNEFDGEPDYPIESYEFEFVPKRDTW